MNRIGRSIMILMSVLASCAPHMEFDPMGWNERVDLGAYPNRDAMLEDLLQRDTLDGLSHTQAIELLGEPNGYDGNEMWYEITVHYDMIDPDRGKNLVLFMSTDSAVTGHYIQEWRHWPQ